MNNKFLDSIEKHLSFGSHLLVRSNQFVIFGGEQHDDTMLKGRLKFNNTKNILYHKGEKVEVDSQSCIDLFNQTEKLIHSSAYALFTLTDNDLKKIKFSVKEINGTHIRIHNHHSKLRISIFDIKKFNDSTRLSRKNSNSIRYIELNSREVYDFSFTIFADSIKKLPSSDYQIRVGHNGICQFEPLKEEVKYYFRDQKLVEPLTVFHSELVGQDIAFVFHPNSYLADEDTNQNLHLEVSLQVS
jgi:hypothetical protein